jgi:hypothetical protein
MRLRAVGHGGELRALPEVSPSAKDNRVSYGHGGVSEWYANGPLGVEQGFTVARAVDRRARGSLTLVISLSGNAHASLTSSQRGITLSHAGATLLEYSGLIATDTRQRVLHSSLSLKGRSLVITVDTAGAHYPLRIDPFIQQAKIIGSGDHYEHLGQFGYSVALSSDGDTALVGARNEGGGVGAAFVFSRSGEAWTQEAELLAKVGEESGKGEFGSSVALSPDGKTALIGSPVDEANTGAAWVFAREGSTWEQQGTKLTGKGEAGAGQFGESVALSESGNTALIGGNADNGDTGAAWVFTRAASKWEQQGGKLMPKSSEEKLQPFFGERVGLSSDGNTALIGAPGNASGVGAAWVFTRTGTLWEQQGKALEGSGESGQGEFGSGVALSSDGSTALIGGWGDHEQAGAAWVFTRTGTIWEHDGPKLTGSGEIGDGLFGWEVALSSDGKTALIGGPGDSSHGAAWVFLRSGAGWEGGGTKLTGTEESAGADFGDGVALSPDGTTALVGGPGDNGNTGAAWAFRPAPPPPLVSLGSPAQQTLTARTQPTFTWTVSDENGPGIAHIYFLLDGAQVGGELPGDAASFTPSAPLSEGSHSWQVRAVDKLGFATTSPARTIIIDSVPPSAPAPLQPPASSLAYQAQPTFSWTASSDAGTGVSFYALVIDGQVTTISPNACQQGTCSVGSPRALTNGSHSWQVVAYDGAGNTAASAVQVFTVAVGPTPPPGPVGISINNGDYATNTTHVAVDVVWPRGANQVLISNDGGFNAPGETALFTLARTIPWTLRSVGSERLPKTVYVRFPDSPIPTNSFTDDIILDTTTPVIHSAKLLGVAGRRAATGASRRPSYSIQLTASETVSGISVAEISSARSDGTMVRFRPRTQRGLLHLKAVISLGAYGLSHSSGVTGAITSNQIKPRPPHRPRWVRVQSAAGTWSPWRRLS